LRDEKLRSNKNGMLVKRRNKRRIETERRNGYDAQTGQTFKRKTTSAKGRVKRREEEDCRE